MKRLVILLTATFLNPSDSEAILPGGHKITLQEAERILGESCQLKESTSAATAGGHKYNATYVASSSDEKSKKAIAIYFTFESYKNGTEAKKTFDAFKISNQTHEGFELISDLGDEAFFQTDNENFCLMVVRKDNEMILIKVNKITPRTSNSELKKVAGEVFQRV